MIMPLDVQLRNTQSRTYGLKVQVGIVRGVLPGFVTGIGPQVESLVSLGKITGRIG